MSISLNANFELLSAGLYLDARQQFNTLIEMKDFAETSIPDGFITYNKETQKHYVFSSSNTVDATLGKWREYNSGNSSSITYPTWNSNVDYKVGNVVLKDEVRYSCIADHTSTDFETDSINWVVVLEQYYHVTQEQYNKMVSDGLITDGTKDLYIIDGNNEGGGGGASEAEFVSYDNESLPSVTNVEECLDAIIAKIYYVNPSITSFTCNPSKTDYEMGEKVTSVTFTWTYNKDMVSQTLTGCDLADETVRTATYSTEFNSNKTFTLSASDGTNSTSANKAFTFQNKVHYGSASIPATYDSAFILSLNGSLKGSKSGTYTVNVGTNQYFYIAMPTSFNNSDVLTGKVGGFDTDFSKVATVSHTNASGYTCDYNIYKSTNHSLGSISMII